MTQSEILKQISQIQKEVGVLEAKNGAAHRRLDEFKTEVGDQLKNVSTKLQEIYNKIEDIQDWKSQIIGAERFKTLFFGLMAAIVGAIGSGIVQSFLEYKVLGVK